MVSVRYNSNAGLELFGAFLPEGGIKAASTALCLFSSVLDGSDLDYSDVINYAGYVTTDGATLTFLFSGEPPKVDV